MAKLDIKDLMQVLPPGLKLADPIVMRGSHNEWHYRIFKQLVRDGDGKK